ncbi:MAG: cation diffusion facilitator family transporter [Zestosphaera sp.]
MERRSAGFREGFVSILVNLLLFAGKYYVGLVHNSIAVVADAVHTLSDAVTSVVVVIGFWAAYRPPDSEHPFGHGRAEQVGAVVIGTLLGVVGFEFMLSSYGKLVAKESLIFSWTLVAVLMASALIKELLARWALKLGRAHKSQSIIGDAWHHRSDAVAAGLLAVGVIVGGDYWWLDGVLGLAVSALIMYTSAEIILITSRELLGSSPAGSEMEVLRKVVVSTSPLIEDLHHVHIHRYGDHVEISLHIRLPKDVSLEEAHRLADSVERAIKNELGWDATVHVEPVR